MSKSLQEQLIAAGLVDKKKAAELERQKRRQDRHNRHQGKPDIERDEAARRTKKALKVKTERDRELNQQRRQAAERKALAAEVRQLVLTNRVDRRDADIAYQFVHDGKIKKIYLNAAQHAELAKGALAVVRSAGKYDVVPTTAAEKIRARDAGAVIDTATVGQDQAEDDYQGFEVPDDLRW